MNNPYMNHLFRKIAVSQRFSETELESLQNELSLLKSALEAKQNVNPLEVRPSLCALQLYANAGEKQTEEVRSFIHSIENEDYSAQWSEAVTQLSTALFADLQMGRVGSLLEKINDQKSLTSALDAEELVSSLRDSRLSGLYENKVDELNIDFTVQILPFPLEVLDPRIVRVAPGKANELHRHAHETVFIFLEGEGKVIVDQFENPVAPGDFAFIPRWCNHQSINTGENDLVFLAVADFGLTGKSFVGNYLKTARMKGHLSNQ
jgi:oxalate decarboxylase/phosphoglucose isomerase-like protein (cupin superfamily)